MSKMEKNKEFINSKTINNEESFTKPFTANESFNKDINITITNPPIEDKNEINIKNTDLKDIKTVEEEKNKKEDEPHNISPISVKSQYKKFIPFVTIKILFSIFYMYKYVIYGKTNINSINNGDDYIGFFIFINYNVFFNTNAHYVKIKN